MTSLQINGQEVVLPAGFQTPLKKENPFFTKNGEYTLEVELSLKSPINARIFKHLNRENNTLAIPRDWRAVLVSDNQVITRGVVAIVGITDSSIKIQILSGNSELNFRLKDALGNALKLWNMDLGTSPDVTTENVTASIDYEQNMMPGVFAPIYSKTDSRLYNPWAYSTYGEAPDLIYDLKPNWYHGGEEGFGPWILQPYLSTVLEQLFTSLGYTLPETQFGLPYGLFIVNGSFDRRIARMLPNWTASDFLTKIETLFDGVFVADNHSKIDFLASGDYYLQDVIVVEQVIDEREVDPAADTDLSPRTANVSYNLPSGDYMAYQKLDKSIMALAETVTLATYAAILAHATAQNTANPALLKKRLYHCTATDTDYICCWNTASALYLQRVNRFQDLVHTSDENASITHDCTPVPMKYYQGPGDPPLWIQVPEIETDRWLDSEASAASIQELVDGTVSVDTFENSGLRFAFFKGCKPCLHLGSHYLPYPISMVDFLSEKPGSDESLMDPNYPTLRLQGVHGLDGMRYSRGLAINTTRECKFSFLMDNSKVDLRKKWLINGKLFVCREIETTVTLDGVSSMLTGKFYPIITD